MVSKRLMEDYTNSLYDDMIDESSLYKYKNYELFEAYSTILNEKLSGDVVDKTFTQDFTEYGGYYKGKKFPSEFGIQNFGKDINGLDEMSFGKKYNIYVEAYDMWFMAYKFKSFKVGLYHFKLDVSNETEPLNAKRLANIVKKGYITEYIP